MEDFGGLARDISQRGAVGRIITDEPQVLGRPAADVGHGGLETLCPAGAHTGRLAKGVAIAAQVVE